MEYIVYMIPAGMMVGFFACVFAAFKSYCNEVAKGCLTTPPRKVTK